MGGDKTDPNGLPFSEHIGNLEQAIAKIAEEINQEQRIWHIRSDTPELDEAGMIEPRVFGLLDRAELGVMDVSAGSPSVMYELAMLHSLGVPTIPVAIRVPEQPLRVPFYLRGTYMADVDSFGAEVLYDRLGPMIRAVVMGGVPGANPAMNPMTAYYGLPLVDISASTGLATGYFHNFLQHILKENGGVFDFIDGKVDKLIVLKPESLMEAASLKRTADRRLQEAGIEVELIGEKDGKVYEDREQARGQMLVYRAGRYIFDAPSPLAAQDKSPRMKRIRKQLIPASGSGAIAQEARELVDKFEQRLIDEFMTAVQYLPDEYPNARADRLGVATLDEFIKMISETS